MMGLSAHAGFLMVIPLISKLGAQESRWARRSPLILVSRPVLLVMACSSVGRSRLELSTTMTASNTVNRKATTMPIAAVILWVLK